MSVDGTDFQIREPWPFDQNNKDYYSFKLKETGLRYEVGLSIIRGDIVWINGPYECGLWTDIKIFRDGMMYYLDKNERVEADKGYSGERTKCKTPRNFEPRKNIKVSEKVRARHETVNKKFKQWGDLHNIFRHPIAKHSIKFRALAIITQIVIDSGEKLFPVKY